MTPNGTFVVVEGIDGSGKTTVCRGIADALRRTGREVVPVREPGGTPEGEVVRSLLLEGVVAPFGPEAESLAFNLARRRLVDAVIGPALDRGAVVVADRFSLSTMVYQTVAGADPAVVARHVAVARAGRDPDLTVLLDLPAEEAAARLARGADGPDRFEGEGLATMAARRRAYLDRLPDEPGRHLVLDARDPPGVSTVAVLDALRRAGRPRDRGGP